MMLQHPGLSLLDLGCLSPPGSLSLDDFASLSPVVKDELRSAIRRRSSGPSGSWDGAGSGSDRAGSGSDRASEQSEPPAGRSGLKRELMTEDNERRKRRRERNKIAAAKCRNKKKEKTECLQKESEKLESVNSELKQQIEELKQQKQQLVFMLNLHRPTCIVRTGQTPDDEPQLFLQDGALQLHGLNAALTLDDIRCSAQL